MIDKLIKLIDVKSIVTLVLTGVFSYLAVLNKISEDQFMIVFIMIMTLALAWTAFYYQNVSNGITQ